MTSVRCVVIASRIKDDKLDPARRTPKEDAFIKAHTIRDPINPLIPMRRGSPPHNENVNTRFRVAELRERVKPKLGNQDGGNGSGGDGGAGAHSHMADMVETRLGMTFWKKDAYSGNDPDDPGADTPQPVIDIFNANEDPEFVRAFESLQDAYDNLMSDGYKPLQTLFADIRIIAINP